MLIVITGPSGSGKTTIYKELFKRRNDLVFSVSFTTRKMRYGEKNGVDYFFVSKEEFERMKKNGKFVEWALVHGDLYGTEKRQITNSIDNSKICILDIDIQGALNVMKIFSDVVTIFIQPPGLGELERRLRKRASESVKEIKLRIADAENELEYKDYFKYIVLNNDVNYAVDRINKIIDLEIESRR